MAMRIAVGAALLALTIVSVATREGLVALSAQTQHDHPAAGRGASTAQGMPGRMMTHEEMMAEMKAADAKLDALVASMNSATGEDRIAAVTAVVNELVRQHKGMHARMGEMQQMMGGHAMSKGR
ncbi:MAG TPA: hypothetical protein VKB50_32790 [Vicinamibacterales bacterium]|nr:hypothetical protein [Vicinamibacterales bacterium]